MFGKKKGFSAARIDTLVGQGTEINGDLVFTGGLHVDGTINGNVVAEEGSTALLILSEFGRIEGEVNVQITNKNYGVVKHFEAGDVFLVEPLDKHWINATTDCKLVEVLSEPYSRGDVYAE